MSGDLQQCENCGKHFFKTDGRQRFCPAPFGVKESRCAIAYRVRKHREKGHKIAQIYIPPDLDNRLSNYAKGNGFSNKADAITKLIELGLDRLGN